ncbi:MAG: flavodoxin family protein, partial [Eggerthellaceae bacterium]|nr:flavodoxin family protein [Eggerthellaceae bacterium]
MYLVISSSPNADGLTAACAQAVCEGIEGAGGQVEPIDISASKLAPCLICDNGWGSCRNEAVCVIKDVLGELQEKVRACDGVVLVTPVYFGQPSDRMKYFLDRFRRCEAFNLDGAAIAGKPVSLIAAAGGSGHGTVTCLAEMETWC